jgi:hypothetical protein
MKIVNYVEHLEINMKNILQSYISESMKILNDALKNQVARIIDELKVKPDVGLKEVEGNISGLGDEQRTNKELSSNILISMNEFQILNDQNLDKLI